jgi:hypothetical protein
LNTKTLPGSVGRVFMSRTLTANGAAVLTLNDV